MRILSIEKKSWKNQQKLNILYGGEMLKERKGT
jgi:hypothetical protein